MANARELFYKVTASPAVGVSSALPCSAAVVHCVVQVCHNLRRLGGVWQEREHVMDGGQLNILCDNEINLKYPGKFVCLDRLLEDKEDCLVYSFGIQQDWSWEDQMDMLGCSVQAFDPTVEHPPREDIVVEGWL